MPDVPDRTDNGPCQGERSAPLSPGNGWLRPHCNQLIALVLLPPVDRPSGWIVPPAVDISLARASGRGRWVRKRGSVARYPPTPRHRSVAGRTPDRTAGRRRHRADPERRVRGRQRRRPAQRVEPVRDVRRRPPGRASWAHPRSPSSSGSSGPARASGRAPAPAGCHAIPLDHEGSGRGARRRPT